MPGCYKPLAFSSGNVLSEAPSRALALAMQVLDQHLRYFKREVTGGSCFAFLQIKLYSKLEVNYGKYAYPQGLQVWGKLLELNIICWIIYQFKMT